MDEGRRGHVRRSAVVVVLLACLTFAGFELLGDHEPPMSCVQYVDVKACTLDP